MTGPALELAPGSGLTAFFLALAIIGLGVIIARGDVLTK